MSLASKLTGMEESIVRYKHKHLPRATKFSCWGILEESEVRTGMFGYMKLAEEIPAYGTNRAHLCELVSACGVHEFIAAPILIGEADESSEMLEIRGLNMCTRRKKVETHTKSSRGVSPLFPPAHGSMSTVRFAHSN